MLLQAYADSLGVSFMETSARLAVNVEEVFVTMAALVKQKFDFGELRQFQGDELRCRLS